MRLTADVCLVGGGPQLGFGLSPGTDCHVYLLESEGEAALVDCGMGTKSSRAAILANLAAHRISASSITTLFLTHYHPDHAGGAAAWHEELQLKVAIGAEAADAVETADEDATGLRRAQVSGLYDSGYRLAPSPVTRRLVEGDHISVGRLRIAYLSTPGHCLGHGVYYVTGGELTYLFTGDCVFHGGRIGLQNIPDCDISAYSDSVTRLSRLSFDALLPGHGAICLTGGEEHVAKAANGFVGLGVPGGR